MLFSPMPGTEGIDPAVLAFVKCHVSSPLKWEALRTLDAHAGQWVLVEDLAREAHQRPLELHQVMAELASEGLVELADQPERYRLPTDEASSVVLHRLIDAARHNQELRAIIVANFQRARQTGSQPAAA